MAIPKKVVAVEEGARNDSNDTTKQQESSPGTQNNNGPAPSTSAAVLHLDTSVPGTSTARFAVNISVVAVEEGAIDDSNDTTEQQESSPGTQNNNGPAPSTSAAVSHLDTSVPGTSTARFAENICVESDVGYPSKHIPLVDPPRVKLPITSSIQLPERNDPSTSNQTQKSPSITPNKRKIDQDEEEQNLPKTKVPRYEDMKDVPGIIDVRGYLFKVRLDMIPMLRNLPPASATQTYSQSLQQQQQQQLDGHVGRPPDMNNPLNLSTCPLDLSLKNQAPDRQMVIGEPALLSYERDQPPIKSTEVAGCQGLASVIGPQYTEDPENTVGQVDDVSLEERGSAATRSFRRKWRKKNAREHQPDDVSLEERDSAAIRSLRKWRKKTREHQLSI